MGSFDFLTIRTLNDNLSCSYVNKRNKVTGGGVVPYDP
ncbi:MAG: hypothetical protein JWQ49_1403 [Edaphobacter sp.]|nr:hypothetical protein [Edaphobacter sp.]